MEFIRATACGSSWGMGNLTMRVRGVSTGLSMTGKMPAVEKLFARRLHKTSHVQKNKKYFWLFEFMIQHGAKSR